MVTLEDVLEKENMEQAMEHLLEKKNSCGDDGVWLHDLPKYWELNRDIIVKQIEKSEYYPQLMHDHMVVTGTGKHRIISHMSSIDRLLLRALNQVLQEPFEKVFSDFSFAYQNGKGIEAAVRCAADYISTGCEYVIEMDVADFFDNIQHEKLLLMLGEYIEDLRILRLLERYLMCKVEYDCTIQTKTKGLIQGNSISPLLSNVYLSEFDFWMEQKGYNFTRFADNINVYVKNLQETYEVLDIVEKKLNTYGLETRADKTGVYPVFSRKYLGYSFEKSGDAILIQRNARKDGYMYKNWHKSAIEKVNQNYYIINDGVLTKKDYSVLFENKESRISIPIEMTNSINIFSDVVLGSNFLRLVSQKKINVNIFDYLGNYVGSFYSAQQRNSMEMLIAQVQVYSDAEQRLQYAKAMDMASIHNLRCNLKYYNKKRENSRLKEGIQYLSNGIADMNQSKSVEQLLLIEGRCRQKYYMCMNDMIQSEEFYMRERTKRPPKDPLNSMISFGNMCLYQRISQLIQRSLIDVRISFVHSAKKRYENLNLDIADIFKPIIVDRVIFSLINKKMISGTRHFVEDGGVFLNIEGKKLFISEFEEKLHKTITVNDKEYTYERLIQQEIKKLEKSLLKGEKYKAYKHQN